MERFPNVFKAKQLTSDKGKNKYLNTGLYRKVSTGFCFDLFFSAALQHAVPRPGIRSEPQMQPILLQLCGSTIPFSPDPLSRARDDTCLQVLQRPHRSRCAIASGNFCTGFLFFILFYFVVVLGPNPRHMEVPRLGIQSEL